MSPTLCVTGMHRSGTSLTASWLERCGLAVHAGSVIGPADGNARGHFEDADFVELHSSAATRVDPRSKGWQLQHAKQVAFSGAELQRAEAMVAQRQASLCMWGWKDPRSVFFLEQWKAILPELKVLLLWRSPEQVLASLLRRSATTAATVMQCGILTGLRLWVASNELALQYKGAHPDDTLLVRVSAVLDRDRELVALMNTQLDLALDHQPIAHVLERELLSSTASVRERALVTVSGARSLVGKLEAASDL